MGCIHFGKASVVYLIDVLKNAYEHNSAYDEIVLKDASIQGNMV